MFIRSLPPRQRRFIFIGFWLIVLSVGLLIGLPSPTKAASPNTNQAFLAVQFNNHDRLVRSLSFSNTSSGLDVLLQSGLDIVTKEYSWGTAVCSIEGVGCPAENCFCDSSKYWSYEYWDGSQWQSHTTGATGYIVQNGDIEGWRWGEWGGTPILPWPQLDAARKALDWLHSQQNSDGGFGSLGSSVEAGLAIGANHTAARDWKINNSGISLAGYLMSKESEFAASNTGAAGKLSVSISTTNTCKQRDSKEPLDYYDSSNGKFGNGDGGPQSWSILGTRALSETVPTKAIDYLKYLASSSGGWEWSPDWGVDTNTTALAIQALLATGESATGTEIQSAISFLHSAQNSDGGFPYDPYSTWGTDSDTDSTAYVLQALYALGEDPISSAWKPSGASPLDFLLSRQLSDGSFEWMAGTGSNLLATVQAIPALLGRPMPFTTTGTDSCWNTYLPLINR